MIPETTEDVRRKLAQGIRWVPMPHFNDDQAGTWWRVHRGRTQLGHVAKSCCPGKWGASHIEPSGRRLERTFATLRAAARYAMTGVEDRA